MKVKLGIEAAAPLALLVPLAPSSAAQLGDTPETGDRVGSALALGDFNVDGILDLAIGVPGESVTVITFPPTGGPSTFAQAGLVHLVFGTPAGLYYAPKKVLKQAPGTASQPGLGAGNAYGSALVCLDFGGDGFDDLAVGIPGQTVNGFAGAGAVQLLHNTSHGLDIKAPSLFHQDSTGVLDTAEAGDAFGASLCAGDFDGDGFVDLAVGAPVERVGSVSKAGAVNVIHGSADGVVKPMKNSYWIQGPGLQEVAEAGDLFGQALAAGDLNTDGFDDLAVGVPEEDLSFQGSGVVHVIYGSATGLMTAGNQLWHQDSPGIAGVAEAGDGYGSALLAHDVDGDGLEDLCIGAPGDLIQEVHAGSVNALFGTLGGLSAVDNLVLSQLDFTPFLEVPEEGDRFGSCLAFHEEYSQVVIGIPGESMEGVPKSGAVQGLGIGPIPFRQVGSGMLLTFAYSPPQPGDALGTAVATGDLTGDGHVDFAVGVPCKDVGGKDAGEVLIVLVALSPYLEVLRQGP